MVMLYTMPIYGKTEQALSLLYLQLHWGYKCVCFLTYSNHVCCYFMQLLSIHLYYNIIYYTIIEYNNNTLYFYYYYNYV